MNKDKKKVKYNSYLKGAGKPPADSNLNQGRTNKSIEFSYKIIHWTFILTLIALISLIIYTNCSKI